MIHNWLSRYSPRYPRALVYMLQASEYHVREYVAWLERTKNFSHIEKRKTLVKNPKVLLLLAITWLILLSLYGVGIMIFWHAMSVRHYIEGIFLIVFAPYITSYWIIIPLVILKSLIQSPIEYFTIRTARKTLAQHNAVKIAIAGSFGKTSMREILKTVLSEGKKVAAPPHSYNTPLGISAFVKTLKGDEEILIFELGEYYPGDVKKLCELVKPDKGIITGINEAHLEKFKTIEKTVGTIFELADWFKEKPIYVNGENRLAKERANNKHILYTRGGSGNWNVSTPISNLNGTSFVLRNGDKQISIHSHLLGLHQIGPLACAAAIALELGLSDDQIQNGINNTKPFDQRLEPKKDSSGVITLDDSYNGNPDGVKAVIDFLASLSYHRRWYVTPGLVEMGTKTETVHHEIGRQLAVAHIEKIILIKNSVTPFIEQGLKESRFNGEIIWFDDALAAFAALPALTLPGDVVLLQNDWPDQYN
ncbi:MAG: UDP-N-acetylmuramoyl-tripeptide--D-alanyl-D-alanine ligase [Patescibacteria group bacterium]